MIDKKSTLRPTAVMTAAALIALFGAAGCDSTKKSSSNASTAAQNVIVPGNDGRTSEDDRSGDGNEMDGRAGGHSQMSGHRAAGQRMGSEMGGMKDDHMGMGPPGTAANSQAPADPPMKDE